jgi:hypothetical protein
VGENRKRRKGIGALLERIRKHEVKIAQELAKPNPDHGLIAKWRRDIRGFEGEVAKKARRLPGRSK